VAGLQRAARPRAAVDPRAMLAVRERATNQVETPEQVALGKPEQVARPRRPEAAAPAASMAKPERLAKTAVDLAGVREAKVREGPAVES
jgi:hypothetical protein